jgi:peptide-methionine (S)-S-oxide reductase
MSIIFFHTEDQRRLATETKDRQARERNGKILTEIVPAGEFYPAEAYHQKYYLRQEPDLVKEFKARVPKDDDFMNSTAAARLNGYLGGYGSLEVLQAELEDYGLSPEGREKLLGLVNRRGLAPACKL